MIEDQERCKRDIIEQVRKLSPETYADAKNLVHFVSARKTLRAPPGETPEDFGELEKSLRTFVLEKRFQSKLAPAKTYLKNLLTDVEVIAKFNAEVAEERRSKAVRDLEDETPSYTQMLEVKEKVLDDIDKTIDHTSFEIQQNTREKLDDFLERIEDHAHGPEWPGLLYALQYAQDVRAHLYQIARDRVVQAEVFAAQRSKVCISELQQAITECLPAQALDGTLAAPGHQEAAALEKELVTEESAKQAANGQSALVPAAVSLDLGDFFDLTDQLELVTQYLPSLSMIAGGMWGYSKIADVVLKHGYEGIVNLGRFAFVSVAVAGGF
jgi:mitofusin